MASTPPNNPTWSASSEAWDFSYFTVSKKRQLISKRGIAGTRSNMVERYKLSQYSVDGRIAFDASPLLLDAWLPRILGAAENADSFALAETVPSFGLLCDAVGAIYQYPHCYVNRAAFRAKADPQGSESIVELIVDVAGMSEVLGTSWPSPAPSISVAANSMPYIFHEGVLTIGGTARPIKDFLLMIDNHLERRWVNSVTATEICPNDRTIMMQATCPFTSAEYSALYNNASADDGISATLVFTNGNMSTTFTMPGLSWADQGPEIRGKQEIDLPMTFLVLKKGASAELTVTNDSNATA
jgi:hypothetical protein